jgi:hypothetical protein
MSRAVIISLVLSALALTLNAYTFGLNKGLAINERTRRILDAETGRGDMYRQNWLNCAAEREGRKP